MDVHGPQRTVNSNVFSSSKVYQGHGLRARWPVGQSDKTRAQPSKQSGQSKSYKRRDVKEVKWRGPGTLREYKASNGTQHLGTALQPVKPRAFPGPPPHEGPPLRVLPIGGLGEIGMNCMLIGVKGRYILIDAGLMFPDFTDLGMRKILPDTSFLHEWRDKIEAVIITHGHEDHIGALPWVVPALDPSTPVYATSFVLRLIKRRLTEFSLYDANRFKCFEMRTPFQAGPFEVEGIRVTHSIPDCCGLIMRSDEGTVVHTGDWKIDETPLDGQNFDRTTFDILSKEKVALFMSDSTNVLSPGRTTSERVVHDSIIQKVLAHQNKGRVIVTQFASNLSRLYGVKAAADASGRKICFVGASFNHYLDAAWQDGRAPLDPKDLIASEQLRHIDPNQVLIVSTGSQGEDGAQLSKASKKASSELKICDSDLILYSAKVIPGNETQVAKMMNRLSLLGARILQRRDDNLHTSGHGYRDELKEVMQLVKPQHFLPVHGEYSFLCEHARLAREDAGVRHVSVIRNGEMLGVHELTSRNQLSPAMSMAVSGMSVIGEAALVNYYNDGAKGTGSKQDMAIDERTELALEGIVVVDVDVKRDRVRGVLKGQVRVTTRGMWTDKNKLREHLHEGVCQVIGRQPVTAALHVLERAIVDSVKRLAYIFNSRKPHVICICHEHDPRDAHIPTVASVRDSAASKEGYGVGFSTSPLSRSFRRRPSTPPTSPELPFGGLGGAVSDNEVTAPATSMKSAAAAGAQSPREVDGQTNDKKSDSSDEEGWLEDLTEKAVKKPILDEVTIPDMPSSSSVTTDAAAAASVGNGPTISSTTGVLLAKRKTVARRTTAASVSNANGGGLEDSLIPHTVPEKPKRGRPRRASVTPVAEVNTSLHDLQVVPEEVLRERKERNPREHPEPGADPDTLAYD